MSLDSNCALNCLDSSFVIDCIQKTTKLISKVDFV